MASRDQIRISAAERIAVRVVPLNYLICLLLTSFLAAFLLYIERDLLAYILLAVSWTLVPALASGDRISFDGRRIRRTGLIPRLWARLTATRDRIKLTDVEQVQTALLRTIKRGGNLIYTYRTTIYGKGRSFTLHSGISNYHRFVVAVFPHINELALDQRSIELRDHLVDRMEIKRRVRAAEIPPADILEGSFRGDLPGGPGKQAPDAVPVNIEKAFDLQRLANELRVTGLLPQSLEAFRRAALMMPRNARLLFEFALCLRSYAVSNRDARAERKALALMRLAERRAGDDGQLLTEIGEGYFQFGEWRRSAAVFRKAIERAGERFRSLVGLAEIALHEGKIAHVIHNFAAARDHAGSPAARRWTKQEIEYFSRLNSDEEYMELEISRMNLLDTLATVKAGSLRIAILGIPVIVIGLLAGDWWIANVGWAVSMISLAVWGTVIVVSHVMAARIPYDMIEDD